MRAFLLGLICISTPSLAAAEYTMEQLAGRWDCSSAKIADNMWSRAYYTINRDGTGHYNATISVDGDEGEMFIQFISDVSVSLEGDQLFGEFDHMTMKKVSFGGTIFDATQMDEIKTQLMADPKSVSKIASLSPSVLEYETDGLWSRCTPRED